MAVANNEITAPVAGTSARVALRLTGVVMSFPGVVALKGVSLEVREGEMHALVGENGAGKSTLMAIAAGALAARRGTVEIGGQVMSEPSPRAAQAIGLAVVYQHPALLPDLTVAENMAYRGAARRPARAARRPPLGARAAGGRSERGRSTRRSGWPTCSVAERHLVEIAKALRARAARADPRRADRAAARARRSSGCSSRCGEVTAAGTAVVYISHRLPEVRRIADRITVAARRRDARHVRASATSPSRRSCA